METLQEKCDRIGKQLENTWSSLMVCPSCRHSIKVNELEKYSMCEPCYIKTQMLISNRVSTIPSRWRFKSSAPYKHQTSSYEKAFAWLNADSNKWLYIYGRSGIGKSHLAGVLANRYISQRSLYWLSYYDFIFASYQAKNQFFKEMKNASLIVIDGFGAVGSMPSMMGALLDYCLNHGKRIIFTSQVYLLKAQEKERLIKPSDRMEPYIAELLIEGISTYLLMEGPNLRVTT